MLDGRESEIDRHGTSGCSQIAAVQNLVWPILSA